MKEGFKIEALSATHERDNFSCGVDALDIYFRERVTQDIKRRVSNCFVIIDTGQTIAGYYTFAASSIPLLEIDEAEKKRLPRYAALPAGLIGRLAVDERHRGQRLGGAMIIDSAIRAANAEPAIFALIVDAKDENASGFYRHLGFERFVSKPMSLYLPIATALKTIEG